MRFLTDENVPPQIISSLRSLGHEVKDVKEEDLQGSTDIFLADLANRDNLVIVTMDKDFARLFNQGLIKDGVIYITHKRQKSSQIAERLLNFLKPRKEKDLQHKLSTVD